jgi:signal transduction histidine kinase
MAQPTVLVVDDEPHNLSAYNRLLNSLYRVLTCRCGEEALRTAVAEPYPDLILLDIMMPEMNGYEVFSQLQEHEITRQLPVIFVTARGSELDEEKGLEMGAVDYIRKPIRPGVMLARISRHLMLKQARDSLRLNKPDGMKTEPVLREAWQVRQLVKSEGLERMAAAVAHIFNNKLMGVIGNLELTLEDLGTECEAADGVRRSLEAASGAAEVSTHMLAYLAQDLMEFRHFDLNGLCREATGRLAVSLPPPIVLSTDVQPGQVIIRGDEAKVGEVLLRLIANAREALDDDRGSILISVRVVTSNKVTEPHLFPVGWRPTAERYACMQVTDTGCGIHQPHLDSIFDPFFSTKFTGRGLGLAVVQGILRQHRAAVAVDSEPGRGSTFRVFWPLVEHKGL